MADGQGGVRLVKVTGKCPHCEVRKHQIDSTEERATQIVSDAIDRHIAEAHCECVAYTIRTDYGTGVEHDVDRSSCPVHGQDADS